MWKSKFFTVMIVLTFLVVAATVALQYLEMKDYGLVTELLNKF